MWLLVPKDTIDDTLPKRRQDGCAIREFCQRCINKVPDKLEDLYCIDCTEHLAVKTSQTGDTEMLPDWE